MRGDVNTRKTLLLLALLGAVLAFFVLGLGRYFSLGYIQGAQADVAALQSQPCLFAVEGLGVG